MSKWCLCMAVTFKLKASQCAECQRYAANITGLWDVGEAWRGQLVGQAFRHAWVTQWLVHQHQGKHLQQAILDVLLQLGDLTAQVVQYRCQCRTVRCWQRTTVEHVVIIFSN